MVARYERILNLIACLLAADEPVSLEHIRESVIGYEDGSDAAVRKRFERDKRTLRDLGLGLNALSPLGGQPGGYVVDRSCLFLEALELTPAESRMLSMLARHFPAEPGTALEANLQSALLKLQLARPDRADAPPALWTDAPRPRVDPRVHDALAEALLDGRQVRLRYPASGNGELAERHVDPYGLGYEQGSWYLVGHCHQRGEVRTFRLSRIAEPPKLLKTTFEPPEGFRLTEHLTARAWALGAGEPAEAWIGFDEQTYPIASREVPVGDREPAPEGGGRIRIRYTDADRLLGWLAGFGSHGRVLAPDALVERARSFLAEVAQRHRGTPAPLPAVAPDPAVARIRPRPARTDTGRLARILTLIPFLGHHPGIHVDEVSRLAGIPSEELLDDLREVLMCGLPPYLPDDYIGVYVEDGRITLRWAEHFKRPVQLTLTEALALRLALGRVTGEAGDGAGEGLRQRIEAVLPPGLAAHLQGLAERIQVASGGAAHVMTPLLAGLADGTKLRAEYYALSTGELTERMLHPLRLVDHAGVLYLIAYCELRGCCRSFHTGRFRTVEATDASFEWPDDVPDRLLPDAGPGERARIRFDPVAGRRIADIFEPEDVTRLVDGSLVLELRLLRPRWVTAWLLTFGTAFEVLSPAGLRRALAELPTGELASQV